MPHSDSYRVGIALLSMCGLALGCSAGMGGDPSPRPSPGPSAVGEDAGPGADAATSPDPGPAGSLPCTTDAQCDDGEECTTDLCGGIGGEFGTGMCEHGPSERCEPVTPTTPEEGAAGPIDPACAAASESGERAREAVFLPFVPLEASRLPDSCDGAFEWQNCRGTLEFRGTAGGVRERELEIDIATYTAGDH